MSKKRWMCLDTSEGKHFVGRICRGSDLLEAVREISIEHGITMGFFTAIGALESFNAGFYDQDKRRYVEKRYDQPLEMTTCAGNISMKDEEIFIHAHVTASSEDGSLVGGHVMPGTRVFAAEFVIRELACRPLVRKYDEETGLALWPLLDK